MTIKTIIPQIFLAKEKKLNKLVAILSTSTLITNTIKKNQF